MKFWTVTEEIANGEGIIAAQDTIHVDNRCGTGSQITALCRSKDWSAWHTAQNERRSLSIGHIIFVGQWLNAGDTEASVIVRNKSFRGRRRSNLSRVTALVYILQLNRCCVGAELLTTILSHAANRCICRGIGEWRVGPHVRVARSANSDDILNDQTAFWNENAK